MSFSLSPLRKFFPNGKSQSHTHPYLLSSSDPFSIQTSTKLKPAPCQCLISKFRGLRLQGFLWAPTTSQGFQRKRLPALSPGQRPQDLAQDLVRGCSCPLSTVSGTAQGTQERVHLWHMIHLAILSFHWHPVVIFIISHWNTMLREVSFRIIIINQSLLNSFNHRPWPAGSQIYHVYGWNMCYILSYALCPLYLSKNFVFFFFSDDDDCSLYGSVRNGPFSLSSSSQRVSVWEKKLLLRLFNFTFFSNITNRHLV